MPIRSSLPSTNPVTLPDAVCIVSGHDAKNPETPKLQGTRRREKEKENHTPPTPGEKERENKQKKKTINRKKRTKIGKEIKRES